MLPSTITHVKEIIENSEKSNALTFLGSQILQEIGSSIGKKLHAAISAVILKLLLAMFFI
jgi:hypothetical protein